MYMIFSQCKLIINAYSPKGIKIHWKSINMFEGETESYIQKFNLNAN